MQWIHRAQCLGTDPEAFDLTSSKELTERYGEELTRDQVAELLCAGCPVMAECAAEALLPLAVGTVRAGVWIPQVKASKPRARARALLMSKARGEDLCPVD